MSMGVRRALVYAKYATREEAREHLRLIEAMSVPWSKDAKKRVEYWVKVAYPEEESSPEDAWRILRMRRGLS
jgi:uncharacterized protein YaeQ